MKGNDFIGNLPENERWSLDGSTIYFDWNPTKEWGNSTYYWKKGMKAPQKASKEEAKFSKHRMLHKDGTEIYYFVDKGQLYSYSIKDKKSKKLFQHSVPVSNLQIGKEEGVVFFKQSDNLFKFDTRHGTLVQLTNFKKGNQRKNQRKKVLS